MSNFSVNPNIKIAQTLPASFYLDQSIFEKSKEDVFAASWQFAFDSAMLKKFKSVPFELLDEFLSEPLLFSNDKGIIQCISNVCTHRGNILSSEPSTQSKLICGYHGRTFNLDGHLMRIPGFDDAENFPRECDHLAKVPLKTWFQFLFVALNPKFDLSGVLAAIENRVGFLPISDFALRPNMCRDYQVDAHWALYCDNYLEGFHRPFLHKALNEVISHTEYETVLFDHCNLQIGYSRNGGLAFDLPETHIDFGKSVAAYYFWIFPNMMFNFYPWGLSINIVKPISIAKTKISFLTYLWDETKVLGSAGAELDGVEHEDEQVVKSVQRGIRSRYYDKGRFSPNLERGVHHFHKLIGEFMGDSPK